MLVLVLDNGTTEKNMITFTKHSDAAESCRRKNNIKKNDRYCVVEGPTGGFVVMMTDEAIDCGFNYEWFI